MRAGGELGAREEVDVEVGAGAGTARDMVGVGLVWGGGFVGWWVGEEEAWLVGVLVGEAWSIGCLERWLGWERRGCH